MPELPEVETTRRGIEPHLLHKTIQQIVVRHPRLRWPIPKRLPTLFARQKINAIERRGKYLLLRTNAGTLILHLGMSGSLRIVAAGTPAKKHDHVDIICSDGTCLRFTDPRRFGCLLYTTENPQQHKLLKKLGVEPLDKKFTGQYLFNKTQHKKIAIKLLIMNSQIVVGVGNIYANEALFKAGIHPRKAAGKLTLSECSKLAKAIKMVLRKAITAGGTTLQNFTQSDGKPGYFRHQLLVYGKANSACPNCQAPLEHIKLGGRQTVYCSVCQS